MTSSSPLRHWLWIVVYSLIFLLFLVHNLTFLDPDFGWHIRMGQMISTTGFPTFDPFSYSMPSYQIITHEWLPEVLIFKIHKNLGFWALAVIFSLLHITILFFSQLLLKTTNLRLKTAFLLVSSGAIMGFMSVRPMAISWLFFLILLLLFNSSLWKLWRYLLPLLFFFWANLHGSFVFGLALVFTFIALRKPLISKEKAIDGAIFLLSVLACSINPYGLRIWHEVFLAISRSASTSTIIEWQPLFKWFEPGVAFLLTIMVVSVLFLRHKLPLWQIAVTGLVTLSAFSALRNIPFLILFAPTLAVTAINEAKKKLENQSQRVRFQKAINFFLWVSFAYFLLKLVLVFSEDVRFREDNHYPQKAIIYLKKDLPAGNILSTYNWGSYLAWKLPEKRAYINGGMNYWRQDRFSVFDEYLSLMSGKIDISPIAQKHDVEFILLPQKKKTNPFFRKIGEFLFGKDQPDLYSALEKKSWPIVYQDETSIIFKSPSWAR